MADVHRRVPPRDQHFDGLPKQLVAFVSEQGFRLAIDQRDASILPDDDDPVWRRFEEPTEFGLGGFDVMKQPQLLGLDPFAIGDVGVQLQNDRRLV